MSERHLKRGRQGQHGHMPGRNHSSMAVSRNQERRETDGQGDESKDQYMGSSSSSPRPPPGKIWLPPLQRPHGSFSKGIEKNRTSHACDPCRRAKAKCSGGSPCGKCKTEGKECIYGGNKRERERQEMARLTRQNHHISQRNAQLIHFLRSLSSDPKLTSDSLASIKSVLAQVSHGEPDQDGEIHTHDHPEGPHNSHERGEEHASAGEVGSTSSLDVTTEDVNKDEASRGAGFHGKSSAVTWIQRAKRQNRKDLQALFGRSTPGIGIEDVPITSSIYHAETVNYLTAETGSVNVLEWPPADVAEALVNAYFSKVHSVLPMLAKSDFMDHFRAFSHRRIENLSSEQQVWLSICNIVFAISAKLAHLVSADHQGDDRDHLIYYYRAQKLGIDERTLHMDPELQNTCSLGLLSVYLLVTDQLNRAWMVCGVAIRHAVALGLHMRSTARDLSDVDKEYRVRFWWSLYSQERLVGELTGRPSSLVDRNISTPLPINKDEDDFRRDQQLYDDDYPKILSKVMPIPAYRQGLKNWNKPSESSPSSSAVESSSGASLSPLGISSSPNISFDMAHLRPTSSTYFICRAQLNIISHEILADIYCAALVKANWSDVQKRINHHKRRLEKWKENLPEQFQFDTPFSAGDIDIKSKLIGLAIFYRSSQMILFRPCLCRFEVRLRNESDLSKDFNKMAVRTCVQSARDIIQMIPLTSDPSDFYKISPFWQTLHYVVQAASVLMLELSYRAEHVPHQANDIVADAKKAVLLFRSIADRSIAARKAWEVFDSLLRDVAPKVGAHTNDMPSVAPFPSDWSPRPVNTSLPSDMLWPPQTFSSAPTTTSEWVHSSQNTMPSETPVWGYTTSHPENLSTQLSSLQPFHASGHLFGQYDDFGLWHGASLEQEFMGSRPEMGDMNGFESSAAAATGAGGNLLKPFVVEPFVDGIVKQGDSSVNVNTTMGPPPGMYGPAAPPWQGPQ